MDVESARMIGAGLALFALAGVGIGVGNIFAALINSTARNPSSLDKIRPLGLLGFAVTEALGIFAFLIALILLFK